jgi:outer membrane protein OmpA-like peptidoglycan-associated protein
LAAGNTVVTDGYARPRDYHRHQQALHCIIDAFELTGELMADGFRFRRFGPSLFATLLAAGPAHAQIGTNGTVGLQVSLRGGQIEIGANLGTRRGDNLFHSFETFGIATGQIATFTEPDTVKNVITRVTGGRQQPWLAVSPLEETFYFSQRNVKAPLASSPVPRLQDMQVAQSSTAAPSGTDPGKPPAASSPAPGTAPAAMQNTTGMQMEICPDTLTAFRETTTPLTCGCSPEALKASGNIYGSDVYADVSPVCPAALHAGAIGKQGGQIVVTPREEPPFYPGVTRNGITSQSNRSKWGGAFTVVGLSPPVKQAPSPQGLLDAAGRPVQAPIAETLKRTGHVQMYINFVTDSADLQPNAEPVLRELLKALRSDPGLRLELVGHTDATGTAAHNQDLSERRALTVYSWLSRNGIDRDRMKANGRGRMEPIADNGTSQGRALNRRVEAKTLD